MKEFVYEDIEKGYENCEFKRVPGKSPVLLFYDHKRRLVDKVDLNSEHLTRKDLNQLMLQKGFRRKSKLSKPEL